MGIASRFTPVCCSDNFLKLETFSLTLYNKLIILCPLYKSYRPESMSLSLKSFIFLLPVHMPISAKYSLLAALLLALCSCASTGKEETIRSEASILPKESPPMQSSASKVDKSTDKNQTDYRIQAKDILYIVVYNEPELSYDQEKQNSLRVSTDGKISFPLLGEVEASGLTPSQLERKLEGLLGDGYLTDPHVSVMVGNYHGSVCVIGEVKSPGEIKLQDREITVVEAISMRGGFTDIASPNRTHIVRMENGVKKILRVKVNRIMKNREEEDVILKPDDTVVVPEAFF